MCAATFESSCCSLLLLLCDCVWHVARCTRYALLLLLLLLLFATQCCTHTSDNNKNTGRQKKRRTSPTKKRTRCTLDSRLTHVARTVGTLDCLRYRALLLLLLVLLLLLLLLLLCCFVLHTKRRRHTRWQSEREVLENASGPRRGLAPNAASTCFLVAKHFACAASQRRRRATAASSAAGASSDGEISSFSLIGSKKRHDAAARRHTHRHTWHTHT